MRKFGSLFFAALLTVSGAVMTSCKEDEKEVIDDNNNNNNGGNGEDSKNILGENTPTPIPNVSYLKAEGGDDGVTIEVTEVENETFILNLKPGKYIQSYKLDVYPLAMLYNYMFEEKKANPDKTAEQMILESIFATDGSGGYAFSVDNLEDWKEWELNWGESIYKQGTIVPGATYLIVAVGCPDTEGVTAGDMTMCYVTTSVSQLIGDPRVEIEVASGYKSISARFEPNDDTYYFYQFCSLTEEIDEFIKFYGEDLYTDLIRCWFSGPTDAKNTEEDFSMGWTFDSPQPGLSMTASAVALDANKTKGEFTKEEIKIKETPEDAKPAKYELFIKNTSARSVTFEIGMYNSVNVMHYAVLTTPEWNAIKDDKDAYAALKDQIEKGGWTVDNRDEQKAGIEYNVKTDFSYGLTEETEYVIVSVARNQYMQYGDLLISEPFVTKKLITNTPELSESKVKITLSDAGRTAFMANYEFNEASVLIYHQYILDKTLISDYLKGKPERLMDYLVNTPEEVNIWQAVQDPEYFKFKWSGMDPATKFYYAMVGEDQNGVISAISIDSISTLAVVGGPNPEMKLGSLITTDNEWYVNFAIVKDVTNHRFMIFEDSYSTDPDYTFEDCIELWTSRVIGEEGFTDVNSGNVSVRFEKNKRYIALCVPYGVDSDGRPKQGKLYMQGFDLRLNPEDPTKCIVFEEEFEDVFFKNRKSAAKANAVAPQTVTKTRLTAKDIPTVKQELQSASTEKKVYMDMKKLGASPKFSK